MSECLAYKILDVHEYFMFYEYNHAIAIYVDTIDCNYRVSQKKGWLVFRARFEVFRGFKSKKFRRLTPIKI